MQEYVLHGWDEQKCAKHKQNAREGGFVVQCDKDGICIYTGRPRVRLSIEEFDLLQDVLDYANTKEMLTQDRERRRTIIFLTGRLTEMQTKKAELDSGHTDRRTQSKSISRR